MRGGRYRGSVPPVANAERPGEGDSVAGTLHHAAGDRGRPPGTAGGWRAVRAVFSLCGLTGGSLGMHRAARRVASCTSRRSSRVVVSSSNGQASTTNMVAGYSGGNVSLATALVGGSVGLGYMAFRLASQAQRRSLTGFGRGGGGGGEGGDEHPMLDMAEIARRAVPRKKSFLYTRSGDKGTSQLYNMDTRPKSDPSFEALGNMDELNASLALAVAHSELARNGLSEMLVAIQSLIIDASALVATPRDSSSARKINRTGFPTWCTDQLEACIDELDARTPPLKTFIVPGGGLAASHLHLARCVCRRAERSLQPLLGTGQGVEEVARYINRLSDLLFAAARYASVVDGKPERPWKKIPVIKVKDNEDEGAPQNPPEKAP
ncbi:unnamed protein product [Ectocarpus sp. 12 AP-2014]